MLCATGDCLFGVKGDLRVDLNIILPAWLFRMYIF